MISSLIFIVATHYQAIFYKFIQVFINSLLLQVAPQELPETKWPFNNPTPATLPGEFLSMNFVAHPMLDATNICPESLFLGFLKEVLFYFS